MPDKEAPLQEHRQVREKTGHEGMDVSRRGYHTRTGMDGAKARNKTSVFFGGQIGAFSLELEGETKLQRRGCPEA